MDWIPPKFRSYPYGATLDASRFVWFAGGYSYKNSCLRSRYVTTARQARTV
jgi:hypothetical protein